MTNPVFALVASAEIEVTHAEPTGSTEEEDVD